MGRFGQVSTRRLHLLAAAGATIVAMAAACGSHKAGSGFGDNGPGGPSGDDGGPSQDSGSGSLFSEDGGAGFMLPPGSDGSSGGGGASGGGTPMTTMIDQCSAGTPSGLTAADVSALLAGGSAGSLRYLYPYSGTVFPRGLIAPTLMWDPSPADYVYVHIKSTTFEYKGCLAPTATGQVEIPQSVWTSASAQTSGASAPFSVSLTLISSGTVTGPITEPVVIAAATLSGSVYYNSYTTKLVSTGGGAVLRIIPGQTATLFLGSNGCTACHSVSANGARMVADPYNALNNGGGASYALTPTVGPNPAPITSNIPNGTFVGMYPDGTLYLGNAHPDDGLGGPRAGNPGYAGPVNAGLFETDTGNAVDAGIPTTAMTPSFSPDGTLLAFNDYAIANGGGLATMKFASSTRTATGYKQAFQVTGTTTYPGWPFFLPDNGGVVFAIGNQADFSGGGIGLGLMGGTSTATSDLYVLDLASGTSTILAQAMGFSSSAAASSGTTYLPYGATELHHNFYPTVSPVAAGGYFWVFFDSYRYYGNNGLQRQLWGTAVDVEASSKYTTDGSHPAFYVTGQELGTGNHRAFTALDPCHANGASCTSGYDCCGGFCTNGVCGLPAPRCSNTGETCASGHTCCDTTEQCINGFCSQVIQ
jgi:hypothetical protein